MNKRIFISGANGQLGSELKEVAKTGEDLYTFSDIDSLDLTKENEALDFLNELNPDYIINCAAYTAVDLAEKEEEKALLINKGIPALLAKYGEENSCKIIHISTDYVFKGDQVIPLKEEDPTQALSKYGESKLQGELELLKYKNSMIIRTSWLYSCYGNNFVKSMIRLFSERKELKIVYDQVGTPTYAADLAKLIVKIVSSDEKDFEPGIYHYSNEGIASWYDFAYEIKELLGAKCKLIPIETKDYPLPAPRPFYTVLNKDKIKKQFSLEIPHWKSSLKICIEKISSQK